MCDKLNKDADKVRASVDCSRLRDTPRTDAAVNASMRDLMSAESWEEAFREVAKLCRDLERERNKARSVLDRIKDLTDAETGDLDEDVLLTQIYDEANFISENAEVSHGGSRCDH